MTKVHVEFDLALIDRLAMEAAEKGVRAATLEAEGILKAQILTGSRSGRIYSRGKNRTHQASAPGEAPVTDYGTLRNSITTEVLRGANEVRGIVTINTEYAAALELGTERMRPRPYLSRLINEYGDRIRGVFNRFTRF